MRGNSYTGNIIVIALLTDLVAPICLCLYMDKLEIILSEWMSKCWLLQILYSKTWTGLNMIWRHRNDQMWGFCVRPLTCRSLVWLQNQNEATLIKTPLLVTFVSSLWPLGLSIISCPWIHTLDPTWGRRSNWCNGNLKDYTLRIGPSIWNGLVNKQRSFLPVSVHPWGSEFLPCPNPDNTR